MINFATATVGINPSLAQPPCGQYVEALRADERVGFTLAPGASAGVRLSRTAHRGLCQAGFESAPCRQV